MPDNAVVSGVFAGQDIRNSPTAAAAAASLPSGVSPLIRQVNHLIHQVAGFDSNVLTTYAHDRLGLSLGGGLGDVYKRQTRR